MLDYHLHLWEHGPRPLETTLEQIAAYCERADDAGVDEIAITEHLFRFGQADALLRGWWEAQEPAPHLQQAMDRYWQQEGGADLDEYVSVALAAKAEGLPVVLGLEVDFVRGLKDDIAALLGGYPFDVLLASVHWLGAWGFDNDDDAVFAAEWDARRVEDVWDAYTRDLEELAASRSCDVLAHPDLCKVFGRRPGAPDEFHARMAEAARASGMAAEVSSAGWRKAAGEQYPAPTLLKRFREAGVPVTTASDAHRAEQVAHRVDDLKAELAAAGYDTLQAYTGRQPRTVAI